MSPNSIWPEKFAKKSGVPGLKPNDPIDYMVNRLLICMYQATENSSQASENAARQVGASLGATFYHLDVEPLAAGYRSMIGRAMGRALIRDRMPYDALNFIELQAIRDKQGPTEAYSKTCAAFPNTPEEQVYQWIEKFFTLWSGNQWKRERYAPSFHADDENLDPKTWCRFPILSGGFDLELAELRDEIIRLKARQREE